MKRLLILLFSRLFLFLIFQIIIALIVTSREGSVKYQTLTATLTNNQRGNTEYYHQVLFQPLKHQLVYFLLLEYPITTGLAELTLYFGYIMPRLKNYIKLSWLIIILPVIAFSFQQHCTLPKQ